MVIQVLSETRVGFILPRPFRQAPQTLDKILVGLATTIRVGRSEATTRGAVTAERKSAEEQVTWLMREWEQLSTALAPHE